MAADHLAAGLRRPFAYGWPFGLWIGAEPRLALPARGALGEPLNVSLEVAESSHGLPKPIRSALRGIGYTFRIIGAGGRT